MIEQQLSNKLYETTFELLCGIFGNNKIRISNEKWNINDQITAISGQFPEFVILACFPVHLISAFKHWNDLLNA
jgi:hypothetical protein